MITITVLALWLAVLHHSSSHKTAFFKDRKELMKVIVHIIFMVTEAYNWPYTSTDSLLFLFLEGIKIVLLSQIDHTIDNL